MHNDNPFYIVTCYINGALLLGHIVSSCISSPYCIFIILHQNSGFFIIKLIVQTSFFFFVSVNCCVCYSNNVLWDDGLLPTVHQSFVLYIQSGKVKEYFLNAQNCKELESFYLN